MRCTILVLRSKSSMRALGPPRATPNCFALVPGSRTVASEQDDPGGSEIKTVSRKKLCVVVFSPPAKGRSQVFSLGIDACIAQHARCLVNSHQVIIDKQNGLCTKIYRCPATHSGNLAVGELLTSEFWRPSESERVEARDGGSGRTRCSMGAALNVASGGMMLLLVAMRKVVGSVSMPTEAI